jgi:hypothetical protein
LVSRSGTRGWAHAASHAALAATRSYTPESCVMLASAERTASATAIASGSGTRGWTNAASHAAPAATHSDTLITVRGAVIASAHGVDKGVRERVRHARVGERRLPHRFRRDAQPHLGAVRGVVIGSAHGIGESVRDRVGNARTGERYLRRRTRHDA